MELEIYRIGGEAAASSRAMADLAERMPSAGVLEVAGIIDSEFGPVTLLHGAGSHDGAGACLGCVNRVDDPQLRISGWSCQGNGMPARRVMIRCLHNRLTLLTSGNDPKLTEFFARAELKRTRCVLFRDLRLRPIG